MESGLEGLPRAVFADLRKLTFRADRRTHLRQKRPLFVAVSLESATIIKLFI